MTFETVVSNPHKLWKFLPFLFLPHMKQIPLKDTRRVVFFRSSYHYLKTMHLFLLGSHRRLLNLVVIKLNIKKKKKVDAIIVLFWWFASHYECLFMLCCISGKFKLCWTFCPFYSRVLLFYFQASITSLVSCHGLRAWWRTNNKSEFTTIISLSSNR